MKKIIFCFFSVSAIFIFSILSKTFAATIDGLYDVKPDTSSCNEGVLKNEEKRKVLNVLNAVRKLHGLKPVTYNSADDILTAKSALIMAANATLTHTPDKNMKCWSEEGAKGSGKSNIHISYSSGMKSVEDSADILVGWLIDSGVDSLGHRRWLLDPFLKYVSFGRVDGKPVVNSEWETTTGAAISVINDENADIKDTKTEFVAYPYASYPSSYFHENWFLSFSVLKDKTNPWGNSSVDFSASKIDVRDESGNRLPVSHTGYNNEGFGLPNILQWKVSGLQNDITYSVNITGVKVEGSTKNYSYPFRLIDVSPFEILKNPEKYKLAETNETETPQDKTANSGNQNALSPCNLVFIEGSTLTLKTFLLQTSESGKMNVRVVNDAYMEIIETVDGGMDKYPLYGALSGTKFWLAEPSAQNVWSGVCDENGAYGKVGDTYFYSGARNDVSSSDIQNMLKTTK